MTNYEKAIYLKNLINATPKQMAKILGRNEFTVYAKLKPKNKTYKFTDQDIKLLYNHAVNLNEDVKEKLKTFNIEQLNNFNYEK